MYAAGQILQHAENDDLIQVARIGVWKALQRFRPDHGTTFSTFAWPTIWGEIMRYQRDSGKANGWHRTNGQIAHIDSLHRPIDKDITLADTLVALDDTEQAAMHLATVSSIRRRLERLPERDKVVTIGTVIGLKQREIAERVGCCQMHASRLQRRELKRLEALAA